MKLAIASDLHLEFWEKEDFSRFKNSSDVDILILAGDILLAYELLLKRQENSHTEAFYAFFDYVCSEYSNVIYIAGNHESYFYDFSLTVKTLKNKLSEYENLHILDNEYLNIEGQEFFGGTMWTSFNNNCNITKFYIKKYMNDFIHINIGNYKIMPDDLYDNFLNFIQKLKENIKTRDNLVVISHHSPTYAMIDSKYARDYHINGGYASDLSNLILDNPQIKYWIHGHLHTRKTMKIGECEIICNAYGYEGYESTKDFQLKIITL